MVNATRFFAIHRVGPRVIVNRTVGDTRTPVGFQLFDVQPVNINGLFVYFFMRKAAGAVKVPRTLISLVDGEVGKLQFDFAPEHVNEAGVFNAWLIVEEVGETTQFPIGRNLRIHFHNPLG